MTTSYSKRENGFETGEHRWSVEDHALIWTRPAGDSLTLPWKDVGAVRAAHAPTRARTWRRVLELTTRKGSKLLIDNSHFKGIADFEDRSSTFVPFVLACLERVLAQAPDARARVGSSPAGYFGQLLVMLAVMALVILGALLPDLPATICKP